MFTCAQFIRLIAKSIFLLYIVTALYGCSKSFDQKIAEHIDARCNSFEDQSCIVDLTQITDFEWDSMYVFGGLTVREEIGEALGFDCQCSAVQDNYMRIVFVKDSKIVKESDYHGLDGDVQFRKSKNGGKWLSYSSSSKFYVLKKNKTYSEEGF